MVGGQVGGKWLRNDAYPVFPKISGHDCLLIGIGSSFEHTIHQLCQKHSQVSDTLVKFQKGMIVGVIMCIKEVIVNNFASAARGVLCCVTQCIYNKLNYGDQKYSP
jgi:hypothetical protein